MRYLTGRGLVLRHTFLDDEVTLTPATVTVTLYPDGSSTSAWSGAATNSNDEWSVTVPAQAQGLYRVKWDGGATAVDYTSAEVVGQFIFTVPEARDSDSEIEHASDYPASEIAHYRRVIEAEFQTITGRSFTPRTGRVRVEANGQDAVWLGLFDCNALTALEGLPATLTVSDFTLDPDGVLTGLEALPEGTVVTAVVDYGFRFPPLDVKRAALIRLRYLLAAETSGVPDRATSYVADSGGTFQLATPGRAGSKTGIPEVDLTLSLYSRNVLADVMAVG